MQVKIMGRLLGEADACDGDSGECIWFENFRPAAGVDLPDNSNLQLHFEKGLLGISCPDTGEILNPIDAVTFFNNLPRSEPL